LVWGLFLKSAPGLPVGLHEFEGLKYASLITARILALAGILQLSVLSIHPGDLPATLHRCGVTGGPLLLILGIFAVMPDMSLRADQILNARMARGMFRDRSFITRITQFPYVIRPLLA